ncbi:MAG: 30S ribosomal protein S8 [Candidatus Binatia bacterium]
MSMTDPIADLLTRIRNAAMAHLAVVEVPWSRIKEQIARLLCEEGYVDKIEIQGEGPGRRVIVTLRYGEDGRSAIVGLRRVSKPSLRIYSSAKDAPKVRNGLGISILSTPKGLLVDREARRSCVGGEVLCEVW